MPVSVEFFLFFATLWMRITFLFALLIKCRSKSEGGAGTRRGVCVWGPRAGSKGPRGSTGQGSAAPQAEARFGTALIPEYLLLPLQVYGCAQACTCSQAASPAAL